MKARGLGTIIVAVIIILRILLESCSLIGRARSHRERGER